MDRTILRRMQQLDRTYHDDQASLAAGMLARMRMTTTQ
jgi:hypothetical protein